MQLILIRKKQNMSLNKYAYGRYQVIDRELHKKDWVKTKDLKDKIELEMGLPISTRQLQKDIIAMKQDSLLGWNAPIVYDQKSKAFRYSDKTFSIKKFDLKEDEVSALKFYAASIYQYREYGLFKDFSNALQKVVEAVSIKSQIPMGNSRLIVQTDNITLWKGIEFLTCLAKAID
ncbi:MAG TPA: hypothetical protein VJY62_15870, partial [Bacteroidia bacterium]|nr:hypothetical protein [Bacteroidia bacterium]